MKAKDTSHIGMIIGAICLAIVFATVLIKFIVGNYVPTMEQVLSLILLGCSPSIPFSPIFISTWFDKIYELKHGKCENSNLDQ